MTRLAASDVRDHFSDTLNRVAYRHERIVLARHGKQLCAMIPMEDLELLQYLEDRHDIEAARRALAESKGRRIPYAKARKELGLA